MKIRRYFRGIFISVFLCIFAAGILAFSTNVKNINIDNDESSLLFENSTDSYDFVCPVKINAHKSMPFQY